jgi:Ni/Co efflux regulator RcnB
MNSSSLKMRYALVLALGGLIGVGPALADPPDWAKGKGKGKGHSEERRDDRGDRRDDDGRRHASSRHFEDRHKVIVHDYYVTNYRGGRCPPGLAKKNNGCMPPGQAKKWRMGQPLPRDVVWYEVPQPLVVQIGPPPSGYRYVRVASDILMIAVGSGMVVDAIRDLGRM